MKHIKLFENFSEAPNTITVKFYGDAFMNHYPGIKVYHEEALLLRKYPLFVNSSI